MLYDVILRRDNDSYIARAKDWPEVTVIEKSRDAAINQLKSQLLDYLNNQVEVLQVEIPLTTQTLNPWLEKFGWFRDDPTFDDLQAEIATYRRELDQDIEQQLE
ncbi:MAG: hypothetical protein F6J87_07645 [Spirulina sp. SIO3F2]|nr:hypothetical protein [Spirulina sp. SIO3F2]